MSEAKFTPGPWRLDGAIVRGHNGDHERPICDIYRELTSSQQTLSNADLIVAAPDLAEAAQEVLAHREGDLPGKGWLRDTDQSRAALAMLAAALAKATGGRS